MKIVVKTSRELTLSDWESYVVGFNEVFNKAETIERFKHKYLNTIDNHSYHALLTNDNEIVGGCTVIPYQYNISKTIERIGLAVDVFIRKSFRTDPMALYQMYKNLKKDLIKQGIILVVAVPNDVSYPYW
jgi:6-pyruvoyl-tetrahydropterin synthase